MEIWNVWFKQITYLVINYIRHLICGILFITTRNRRLKYVFFSNINKFVAFIQNRLISSNTIYHNKQVSRATIITKFDVGKFIEKYNFNMWGVKMLVPLTHQECEKEGEAKWSLELRQLMQFQEKYPEKISSQLYTVQIHGGGSRNILIISTKFFLV